MEFSRPGRLRAFALCLPRPIELSVLLLGGALLFLALPGFAQQPNPPQAQPAKPPQQKKANPFETVPQAGEETPQPNQPAQPAPAKPQAAAPTGDQPPEDIIETIDFRGARRVPQDTLRALIFTKKGDKYDEESLHRDFLALWNTQRFDDITMEREPGKTGWIVRFVLVEGGVSSALLNMTG